MQGNVSDRRGKGWENTPTYTLGGLDTTVTVEDSRTGDSIALEIPEFVQFSGECDAAANLNVECQGRRLPYDFQTNWRANAKLTYTYGSGSRLSFSGLWDQDQNRGLTKFH